MTRFLKSIVSLKNHAFHIQSQILTSISRNNFSGIDYLKVLLVDNAHENALSIPNCNLMYLNSLATQNMLL